GKSGRRPSFANRDRGRPERSEDRAEGKSGRRPSFANGDRGFRLELPAGDQLALIEPLDTGEEAALRAILDDGQAWPVRSLAAALDCSTRTVQRALAKLFEAGEVRAIGDGRSRRWARVDAGARIASQMLLLGVVAER